MFRSKSPAVHPHVITVCSNHDQQEKTVMKLEDSGDTGGDIFAHYYDSSKLHRLMKPLLFSMWLTGTYFERDPSAKAWADMEEEYRPSDTTRRSRKKRYPLSMIYSTVILVILWLNVFRICTGLASGDKLGPMLFLRILILAWTGLCTLNYTAMYRGSMHTSTGFAGVFMRWRRFQNPEYGELDLAYAKRHIKLYVGACWGVTMVQVLVVAYGLFRMHLMHVVMTPFPEDFPGINYIRIAYLIIHFYLSTAWTFPVAMQVFLCLLLNKEYDRCNKALSKVIDKDGKMLACLETYRVWHNRICMLVLNIDSIVGLQIGGMLITCMVEVCIIMYCLIWYEEVITDIVYFACFLFWLCTANGKLVLIAVGGVLVNDAAHGSYELLHSLDLIGLGQRDSLHLTVFLNRLSSTSIGLTALKLFVIDKPTILTIVGMLITYFVLIVQFSPPDDGTNSVDCMELILNSTLHCYSGPAT